MVTESDLRGNWTLMYFGYTSCPDVGPEEVQKMADGINILGGSTFIFFSLSLLAIRYYIHAGLLVSLGFEILSRSWVSVRELICNYFICKDIGMLGLDVTIYTHIYKTELAIYFVV